MHSPPVVSASILVCDVFAEQGGALERYAAPEEKCLPILDKLPDETCLHLALRCHRVR
jgi:hypothetical protein